MKPYLTTTKKIGETPLQALERLREESNIPSSVPLAYAGRLDPMASGQLLVLIGDECKVQERYHSLDKEYVFEVLLGVESDTHDVLGLVSSESVISPTKGEIEKALHTMTGTITLPYPHFSSKTVHGKPLHMWTLEGRIDEILIPTKTSKIYTLSVTDLRTIKASDLQNEVRTKVNSIPAVTDPRKELGKDFRRVDVKASWDTVFTKALNEEYTVLTITCICSSGTYMRTLAHTLGKKLGAKALAYSIHRKRIGRYVGVPGFFGFWIQTLAQDQE